MRSCFNAQLRSIYNLLARLAPVIEKRTRQTQSTPPHNVRLSVTSESPVLLELAPLVWHTNPEQFRVRRAIQSPSAEPTPPSRHPEIAPSQSKLCHWHQKLAGFSFISTQFFTASISACLHTQNCPCAVQPHTAMSRFEPELTVGRCQGLFRVSYVIQGLLWGCFLLHLSPSPTSGLPPSLAHLDERLDVTQQKACGWAADKTARS